MIFFFLYAVGLAALNTGAGRDYWGISPSTTLNRLIFACGGALLTFLFLDVELWQIAAIAVCLFLYRWFDWGEWFAAIHGRKHQWRAKGDTDWEEWLSDKIWPIDPKDGWETRLKATLDMSIRMVWAVPLALIMANPLHVVMFPLLGITYFLSGLLGERNAVARAEFANGLILAAMIWGW